MSELFDLLSPPPPSTAGLGLDGRIFGVVTGVVTNNQDPDGLGRVKLRFVWLGEEAESNWARRALLMGGAEMGTYFLPEVDDEVLVAFEHGNPDYPIVLGSLWNGTAKPPEAVEEKNNMRTIRSRSGHTVRFDDTEGAEKIEIIDKTTKNSIVFSSADNTLTLLADADITIRSATGKVVIDAKAGVEITSGAALSAKAEQGVAIEAGTEAALKSGTTLEVSAGTNGTVKSGANLEVSAGANGAFKAAANGDVNAGAILTVKGSLVNIN